MSWINKSFITAVWICQLILFINVKPAQPYNFGYNVKDSESYVDFDHSEKSYDKVTTGSYRVALPDGRTQIVTYKADAYGYTADVKYEGEAKYPEYVEKKEYKTYTAPAYTAPAYTAPAYTAPAYTAPAYKAPAYTAPAYTTPAYTTPAYTIPAYTAPAYTAPAYKAPAYTAPAYTVPAYTAPAYTAPAYTAPAYTTPAYTTAAYEEPEYKAPEHEEPEYKAPEYDEAHRPVAATYPTYPKYWVYLSDGKICMNVEIITCVHV